MLNGGFELGRVAVSCSRCMDQRVSGSCLCWLVVDDANVASLSSHSKTRLAPDHAEAIKVEASSDIGNDVQG